MNKLAILISRVLDPIVVVPIFLGLLIWQAYIHESQGVFLFLLFILGFNVVIPGILLSIMEKTHMIKSGWDIRNRQERIPLFFFILISQTITLLLSYLYMPTALTFELFGIWLITLVYTLITLFWKISVHVGVLSAGITFAIIHHDRTWAALYGLVLLVMWARVYGKFHRFTQVLAGAIVPTVILIGIRFLL